ncbi:hypothetical protein HMN09_01225700 [Mycena chlorophos]|uniref:Integral membrane protein n=1 Tax=Mycena chlorophos TaxID=658473 RepID=A0A8H6S428_MYCCL|nr:hypothetical protein HMN09_01225700 [Mycena chlorophos]
MPSVRVRRSTISGADPDRSLAAIFGTSTSGSPPLVPGASNTLRGSRIQNHFASANRASGRSESIGSGGGLRASSPESPPPRPSTPLSLHSGSNADGVVVAVRARADGQQGLIGSALSVPSTHAGDNVDFEHHDEVVDHLDVIDPQVATVATLTNAANAILFPPTWYSLKPVVTLSGPPAELGDVEEGTSKEYEDSLDRHVEDVLARPSKIRRTLKGVWAFLKTPLGVLAGIYGFCVVFWGAAIIFFLAKFINLHNENTQGFWVEVSSQVVNGLFTVTGLGLIPSRVLDTYRVFWIWYYKRRTRRLRAKAGLPTLFDEDDLPDPAYDPNYVHVLTDKEQKFLHRQQVKFAKHQTWYRAHGTETHRAFPINTALLICCLNDGNSIFQIMLCGTMWGLNRFQRPAWSTGCLIPASFLCGIFAAVFIAVGSSKTKRIDKVRARLQAALAMQHPAIAIDEQAQEVLVEKPVNGQPPVDDLVAETAMDERMVIPPANEKGTVS